MTTFAPQVPAVPAVAVRTVPSRGAVTPVRLAERALDRSPGRPVDADLSRSLRERGGHDLADVRIHEGPAVRVAALGLGAQAFTVGRRVGLGAPVSGPGRTGGPARTVVLAHELTHVVQQTDPRLPAGDRAAAERAADQAGAGRSAGAVGRPVEVACSVGDWLRTTPNIALYSRLELQRELAEIEAWLATSSGPTMDAARVMEAQQLITAEIARRDTGAGEPTSTRATPRSTATATAPATVAVAAPAEREAPGVLGTIGGALLGEFEEDPTLGMIALDTGISLIPIVDQIADARDVVAHLYWMIERGQHNRVMRWIGLVLSLIGAIPEIGTAIKGASKILIKGAREALGHLDELLGITRRLMPDGGDVRRLMAFVRRHWNGWRTAGATLWASVLDRVHGALDSFWGVLVPGRARFLAALANIQRRTATMLPRSFDQLLEMMDAGMARLLAAIGLDPAAVRRALDPGELAAEGAGRVESRALSAGDEGAEALSSGSTHMASTPGGPLTTPGTGATSVAPGHVSSGSPVSTGPVSSSTLPPSHRAGSLDPEVAGGFARAHVRALGAMLGVSFDTPGLRRLEDIWRSVTNPGDLAALTLGNSRRLFNNHRRRFWGAVQDAMRDDAALRAMFDAAGLRFGRRGTAPFYERTVGRVRVTIDHILERQTAPGRALDPTNLRLSLTRENTVLLRLITALDPFQGARIERRASRVEAADIEEGIDELVAGWIDVP